MKTVFSITESMIPALKMLLRSNRRSLYVKIALNRLRWPSRLEDIFREKYENVIKKYMGTAFTLAVKDQDFPMLQFICEHFSPDASALASAIDQCIEKEWGEGNAFLIEAKHKSFSKKTFDFDLDF